MLILDISGSYSESPNTSHGFESFDVKSSAGIFMTINHFGGPEYMLWDPLTCEVTQLPALRYVGAAENFQATSVSNNLYVMFRRSNRPNVIVQLDRDSSEQWEEIPLPASARRIERYKMCSEGKFIFILALDDGIKLHCYDTDDNTWTETSDYDGHLSDFMMLSCCMLPAPGCLYIMGSDGMTREKTLCLRYTIASDTWTELSSPHELGPDHMAVFLETKGEIYVFIQPKSLWPKYPWIEIYNIAADTWRRTKCTLPVN
jgi:hypothetical protein